MRRSERETIENIELATGYRLSPEQANALSNIRWGFQRLGPGRSAVPLKRLGLIIFAERVGKRGKITYHATLTRAGNTAAEALADMAEYGAYVASVARLAHRDAAEVWIDILITEGRACPACRSHLPHTSIGRLTCPAPDTWPRHPNTWGR